MNQSDLKSMIEYDPINGKFKWIINQGLRARNGQFITPTITNKGYERFQVMGKKFMAHRLAWLYMTGNWPSQIDHINRNPSDNRWLNLREVSNAENCQNKSIRSDNKSGVAGVTYKEWPMGKCWHAAIVANNKRIQLGHFYTKEEAIAARLAAEKVHHISKTTNANAVQLTSANSGAPAMNED